MISPVRQCIAELALIDKTIKESRELAQRRMIVSNSLLEIGEGGEKRGSPFRGAAHRQLEMIDADRRANSRTFENAVVRLGRLLVEHFPDQITAFTPTAPTRMTAYRLAEGDVLVARQNLLLHVNESPGYEYSVARLSMAETIMEYRLIELMSDLLSDRAALLKWLNSLDSSR